MILYQGSPKKSKVDDRIEDSILIQHSESVPSASQQLKEGITNKIYLRNIPTLLLFNLIHGRSI